VFVWVAWWSCRRLSWCFCVGCVLVDWWLFGFVVIVLFSLLFMVGLFCSVYFVTFVFVFNFVGSFRVVGYCC